METTASAFDRALAVLDMPDTLSTQPSTIVSNNPILGHGGTHIIQTARQREDGFSLFIQVLDIGGGQAIQLVLPDKVCRAIYRQRQSLIDRARRKPKRPMTVAERKAARLREARRVIRESKNKH